MFTVGESENWCATLLSVALINTVFYFIVQQFITEGSQKLKAGPQRQELKQRPQKTAAC